MSSPPDVTGLASQPLSQGDRIGRAMAKARRESMQASLDLLIQIATATLKDPSVLLDFGSAKEVELHARTAIAIERATRLRNDARRRARRR